MSEEIHKLNEIYDTISKGNQSPELLVIECPTCCQSFVLTKNANNLICEHLKLKLK